MSRARDRRRSAAPGPNGPGVAAPSLLNGMRGLSQLAGNRAMVGVLARRKGSALDSAGADPEPEESLEEGERSLAALRVTLDEAQELLKAAEDGDPRAYDRLRAWVQRVLEALDASLAATEDYDGALAEEAEKAADLPEHPGRHRLRALTELARLLHARGEQVHARLSGQLPGMGAPQAQPLEAGATAEQLVADLRKQLRRRRAAIETDREPEAAWGPPGLGALALGGRRGKRKRGAG